MVFFILGENTDFYLCNKMLCQRKNNQSTHDFLLKNHYLVKKLR